MAEQEFDNLLKNINQINAQLEITNKLIADLSTKLQNQASSPLANVVKAMEADVRRLTELKGKLTYEGVSRAAGEPRSTGTVTDAQARLGAREKVLGNFNKALEQHTKELEDAVTARVNAIQNELLKAAIAVRKPVSPSLKSATEKYLRGYTLDPEKTNAAGGVFHISTPGAEEGGDFSKILSQEQKAAQSRLQSELKVTEINNKYADNLARQVYEKNRETFTDLRDKFNAGLPKASDNLTKTLSAREIAEKEATEAAQRTIQAESKYAKALSIAAEQGYSPENLKRLRTRGTGGIEQLQFQRTDDYGKQRNLDLFVNKQGNASAGVSNQFRTFGQGVVRDIGELTKWSIALAAVYGPLRKIQELTQIMIENQTRLAEATISVNSSFIGQNEIFDASAQAAEKAGESISGVIDAFTQAFRATGGGGDETERFATANKLLADSLTLSKLSTLDQAGAIDTLSAALRQTGTGLTNGTDLLDKWVRVTKVANVDLEGLATGFAVLGDAADAAGIGVDELNGLIAAIAETGVASGRELANTARAIVAGFQSDQARQALENIGVAFEDSTGQARPFLEVMKELSNLRQAGALDDTTFSKLTLALGGGTRRQAAFATLIENFGRVGEVAEESSRASGDAAAALAKQLETVQTSLTKLGNAFQTLAQTLGTEGGFLGIITEGVDGMTALVKVFDGLTSVLGKATPALAAFIATSLILKSKGQGGIQQALFGYGQSLQPDELSQRLNQVSGTTPVGDRFRQSFGDNVVGKNVPSGIFQGIATSLIPALLNATNKQDRFGGVKAGADVIGGIGGGIVGSLLGASPILGATIGTAISEAFVNSTIARKTDIFGYGPATLAEPGKTPGKSEDLDKRLRDAEAGLYKSIAGGNEGLGRLLTTPTSGSKNVITGLNKAIQDRDKEKFDQIVKEYGPTFFQRNIGFDNKQLQGAYAQNRQVEFNPQTLAYNLATEKARKEYDQALAARGGAGNTPQNLATPFSEAIDQNTEAFKTLLAGLKETTRGQIRGERASGGLGAAEYARKSEALTGADTKALNYYTALGEKVNDLGGGAGTAAEQFKILNRIIVSGADESIPQITSITGEIENLINLINNPNTAAEDFKPFGGIEGAKKQLQDLRETAVNLINDVNQQVLVNSIKIPSINGDISKPLTTPEEAGVEQRTKQLQDNFYKGFLKIPDDMYDALKKSWEAFSVAIQDSGDEFYKSVTETDQQFRQAAIQQLQEEGKLRSQQANPFDIQKLDISSQQGAGLQGSIDYFSKYLAGNFPQYEQKPEDIGVIFNDYVTSVLHGDNLAVKLALEKLVDINQKQLDGMYNIPEGATFWVPLTAAYYKPKNEGGTGGLPAVDAQAVNTNTSATDENTGALAALTAKIGAANVDKFMLKNNLGGGSAGGGYNGRGEDRFRFRGDIGRPNAVGGLLASETTLNRKSEEAGFGVASKAATSALPPLGFWDNLLNSLKNLFSATPTVPSGHGGFGGGGGEASGGYRGLSAQTSAQQVNPQVNARLQIQMDNTTQLVVDGRVLASVISPFLSQEMVRLESSQGTITKRYVI